MSPRVEMPLRTRLNVHELESRVVPAIVPIGFEFRVNDPAAPLVDRPAVALDGDGDFVVAWQANYVDGNNLGVFARRYDRSGVPVTAPFQVNIFTTGAQQNVAVAADAAGNFVVVWSSASAQDGSRDGIFARRYNAAGAPVSGEFQVNQFTLSVQGSPAVSMDGSGDFVIAWESNYQDGDGYAIYARKYAASGAAVSDEFRVNEVTTGDQRSPSVAIDASGGFVIAWQSDDGSGDGVFARRYSAGASPLTGEIPVNVETLDQQTRPRVASNFAGDFAVVWESRVQDAGTSGIYLRRFNASGASLGGETRVNTYTTGDQIAPMVSSNSVGDLAVTWQSWGQDGEGWGVFGQRYAASGAPIGGEFRVTTSTSGQQFSPAVGSNAFGSFVVSWISDESPLDGVLAQIYSGPPVPRATLTVNEGQAQRSSVRSLTLTFNTLINFAPGGVTLTGPAGPVTLIPDYSLSTVPYTVARYTFSGPGVTPGGLIDGVYTLTVNSSLVTNYDGDGYDGDGDGLPGPNGAFIFHRLFGDYDGNRRVEPSDFLAFRLAFLSTAGPGFEYAFDNDGNGIIDAADFLQFRLRFLQSI
jgi:hypothetical protein